MKIRIIRRHISIYNLKNVIYLHSLSTPVHIEDNRRRGFRLFFKFYLFIYFFKWCLSYLKWFSTVGSGQHTQYFGVFSCALWQGMCSLQGCRWFWQSFGWVFLFNSAASLSLDASLLLFWFRRRAGREHNEQVSDRTKWCAWWWRIKSRSSDNLARIDYICERHLPADDRCSQAAVWKLTTRKSSPGFVDPAEAWFCATHKLNANGGHGVFCLVVRSEMSY